MITQIISEKLTSLSLDTTTIAALSFSVFLVIYFFAKIKPAIDSNARVRRQVQRLEERDKAKAIYQNKHSQKFNQQSTQNRSTQNKSSQNNQPYKKRVYTAKQKSYYAYLRKNNAHLVNKQTKKHNSFKAYAALGKNPVRVNSGLNS